MALDYKMVFYKPINYLLTWATSQLVLYRWPAIKKRFATITIRWILVHVDIYLNCWYGIQISLTSIISWLCVHHTSFIHRYSLYLMNEMVRSHVYHANHGSFTNVLRIWAPSIFCLLLSCHAIHIFLHASMWLCFPAMWYYVCSCVYISIYTSLHQLGYFKCAFHLNFFMPFMSWHSNYIQD